MIREQAIKWLKTFRGRYGMNELEGAVDTAIKALEQESILDKIEKEINTPNRGTCDYFIVDRIEEIIDKYKAESEDKECR